MKRVVRLLAIPAGCLFAGCAINVDVQRADTLGDLAPRISLFNNRERMLTQHSKPVLRVAPRIRFDTQSDSNSTFVGEGHGISVVSNGRAKFGSRVAGDDSTQQTVASETKEPSRFQAVSARPLSDQASEENVSQIRQVNVFGGDFDLVESSKKESSADPLGEPGRLFESNQPAAEAGVIRPIPDQPIVEPPTPADAPSLGVVSSQGSSTLVIPEARKSIAKRQRAAANLIRQARGKLETRETSSADDLATAAQDLDAVYQLFDDRPELVREDSESADEAISLIEQALEDLRTERIELARQKTIAARKLILSETTGNSAKRDKSDPVEPGPGSTAAPSVLATDPPTVEVDESATAFESVKCRIRVKRTGVEAARDVAVSMSLPSGSSFVDAGGPVRAVVESTEVSYAVIETLPFGAEASFDVTMSLPIGGDIGLKIRIQDDRSDSNQAKAWDISIERLP